MKKERFEDWFNVPFNVSKDTSLSFIDDLSDNEKTRPLGNVKKLRKVASEINIEQLTSFSKEDEKNGVVEKKLPKDQLLLLSEDVRNYFKLGDFIPHEEQAEIFISAGGEQLFLGVSSGSKRVKYKFDPYVRFLTARFEYNDEGVWKTEEEKFVDDYKDPMMVLELFQNQED